MVNITIRNIPDDVFSIIKKLSDLERRSINNELLIIIEKGTASLMENKINENKIISKVSQINLWRNLSGKWEDTRTSEEIIKDIYDSRTLGREFDL
jgi:plasmid stability protein